MKNCRSCTSRVTIYIIILTINDVQHNFLSICYYFKWILWQFDNDFNVEYAKISLTWYLHVVVKSFCVLNIWCRNRRTNILWYIIVCKYFRILAYLQYLNIYNESILCGTKYKYIRFIQVFFKNENSLKRNLSSTHPITLFLSWTVFSSSDCYGVHIGTFYVFPQISL